MFNSVLQFFPSVWRDAPSLSLSKDRVFQPGQILFVKVVFEVVVVAYIELVLDFFAIEINP